MWPWFFGGYAVFVAVLISYATHVALSRSDKQHRADAFRVLKLIWGTATGAGGFAAISRLTLEQIHTGDDVRIHLGSEPVVLPEPLAGLVRHRRHYPTRPRRHRRPWRLALAVSRWAARTPYQRLPPGRTTPRARNQSGQSRSTALFQLATDLLARMLGIHISVAVASQRASSGDWAAYAADVSRRAGPDSVSNPPPAGHPQEP